MNVLASLPYPEGTQHIGYADDVVLQTTGRDSTTTMEESLNLLTEKCEEIGFTISQTKTKAMAKTRNTPPEHTTTPRSKHGVGGDASLSWRHCCPQEQLQGRDPTSEGQVQGKQNRRCVNCNNGNECQNPSRREQGREREEEEAGDNLELQEEGQQDGRQRDNEMPESPIALTPVSSPRTPPPPHDVPQRTLMWRKMREGTSSGKVKRKKKQKDG
ncbi:hypothetical protein GWK47_015787 [Chionoecetes opilio]|uniref:Reverse transcriptase domain-containing protein n=1 Tax=Chionoecetes opilio TaxID=41210 RepID=A0A8J5CMU1_CHIOP|nr:hypothetical protein GWK47_015787 [Chionoecetes opilio]